MSDWKPEIVRLGKIEDLPKSDFLSITTVMDIYPCILKKGQYKEGDLVSWIPYDSVLPRKEEWLFLGLKELEDDDGNIIRQADTLETISENRLTIKAKSIRGTYSEGLITDAVPGLSEGDSVVEALGLTKRVYPEEICNTGSIDCEKNPSTFSLFKYDLDGVAKYGRFFENGEQVVITEKLEGENCSITHDGERLYVRSRNLFKKEVPGSYWWGHVRENNLEEKLSKYPMLAFWGELYGGCKGWFYDCKVVNRVIQRKFRVFDIWDIKNKKFLEWEEVENICKDIEIETVPVLYQGSWKSDQSLYKLSEGNSIIGSCVREGMVVKSIPESWHSKFGRKILKLKGKGYKLKKK